MKIITGALSNFFKTLRLIRRIEQDDISYPELIEYLYGETPPENNDFLRYDYASHIAKIIRRERAPKNQPIFSVIIATYNRREPLLKNLKSVTGQNNISPAEFEVVIIDNGSKDETEEAVKDFTDQNGRANIVYIKLKRNYGADFARNIGVLNSQGRLLAFTDDDCIVPPDWLSEFKKELEADLEIAGVGGFKIPRSIKNKLDIIDRLDTKLKNYIKEVIKDSQIARGSRLYEHGISLGRTADLLGISKWELIEYSGKTGISEIREGITLSEDKRLRIARGLFNG